MKGQLVVGFSMACLLAVWAGGEETSGRATIRRVLATEGAAVERAPAAVAARERIVADAAGARRSGAGGAAWIEYQREGIGPSFTHRPNAQTTLRAGIPFVWPWRADDRSRLRARADDWQSVATEASSLGVAAEAARRWLELAAITERLGIVRARVERLDRAVALQQRRLELGEISGMELTQLELERARWRSTVAGLEADTAVARERLRELCGEGCLFPRNGDLLALERATSTPDEASARARLEAAPAWRMAGAQDSMAQERWSLAAVTAPGHPEVELEWEQVPAMEGLPGYDAAGLRLRVPLPIGSDVKAARAEAAARQREAAAGAEAERVRQLRTLTGTLEAARRSGERNEELGGVLENAASTERALAEQFRLGAISYLVYIDGLGRLDDVRLDAVEARRRLLAARLELAAMLADPACFPVPAGAQKGDER
ncbi:MAG: TolC family protein [Acidobacteria bacterium]|nr:TolC family protein [Acidobacteriota bacterium]